MGRRPNGKDRGGTSSDAMYSEKDKKKHNPHRKHPTKDKKKLYKKKEVRQAEPEPSESSSESEEDQAPESKFASVYHTIDKRPTRRNPSRRMSVPTGKPHRWSTHGAAGDAGSGGRTMNNTENLETCTKGHNPQSRLRRHTNHSVGH